MGGGTPALPEQTKPPETTDPEVEAAAQKERDLARRRRGRESTMLTGGYGINSSTAPTQKTLLGGAANG